MRIVKQTGILIAAFCLVSQVSVAGRSPEAAALLNALKSISGQYLLLGHQDATAYGIDWAAEPDRSDIKSTTGAYPAVHGWDVGHLEIGRNANLDNVSFSLMRDRIIEAYERGGINTISWHSTNPVNGESAWDTTRNSVKQILPGGKHHGKYNDYLNRLARFFKTLKTNDGTAIPIIFRPFHEHTGSWFWWGEAFCTPQEYQALWRYTVDYLRDKKGLANLLFAYSSSTIESEAHYLVRYPGDDYVDIMGFDEYCMGDEQAYTARMAKSLAILTAIAAERDKVAAITETGYEQIPNPHWFTQVLYPTIKDYPVAWVLLWRNAFNRPNHFYAPYPAHSAAEDFRNFYRLPAVRFEDGLAPLHIYQPTKP
ncbi:glycoside hydrolase family 26 protein [Parapedobacter soli]|uniref:glycoside hydrolase family 26 protein n=1 Tax=Parapedobacter soli TaxID=416955 RepID=UPI0021CA8A5C|nr:glycoside hydrolase family 26 protein [Parapedobacter soli]